MYTYELDDDKYWICNSQGQRLGWVKSQKQAEIFCEMTNKYVAKNIDTVDQT